jgi:hypothetical protein
MRVWLSFIKWTLVKIGEGLHDFHRGFKRDLAREPGMALVAWFFLSLLSSIVMLLVLGGIQHFIGIDIPVQVWLAYIMGCVIYLLYTGINIMYTAFKAERAELFETIKNGK